MVILLVDSDKQALSREMEHLTQKPLPAAVSLYSKAEDAIRYARHHEVDYVFTREVLADMTGRELAEKIHEIQPRTECRIYSQQEDILFDRFFQISLPSAPHDRAQGSPVPEPAEAESIEQTEEGPLETPAPAVSTKQEEGGRAMTDRELRGLNRRELLEIMIEQGKELESSKAQYEKDLAFLKAEHQKDIDYLKSEHQKDLDSIKADHQKELDGLNADHQKETDNLREEYEKQLGQLKADLETARASLEEARAGLEKREIDIDEAGSIAMAALRLNGVFEAAQAASQQYIENIRSLSERQEAICARRDAENQAEQQRKIQETSAKCAEMEYQSRRKCEDMEAEARRKSEAYWTEVSQRLQLFYDNHQELKKLLNFSAPNLTV